MTYKICTNDNGTTSCTYKFAMHSDDLIVTYVPEKDYYMIETPGPRSARWIVPSDLLDALYNVAWESRPKPNERGWYLCCAHDYESKQEPCTECMDNKYGR